MLKNVIIIGSGGHAKVIADIIMKSGDTVVGFLDDNKMVPKTILNIPVIGTLCDIEKYLEHYFIIGIGNNYIRQRISQEHKSIKYYTAVHPSATIGIDVQIGEGSCVMANAAVNVSSRIGKHCIINTGAVVEHDNIIEDYVHISPNATLAGTVKIGELTHIGAGANIRNNINITKDCTIGVGGVVVKNIDRAGTYIGVPVREII